MKRVLNLEQQRQLAIAQENLGTGRWKFAQYSRHLSQFVFVLQ